MKPSEYMKFFGNPQARTDTYTVVGIDPGETTGLVFADVYVLEIRNPDGSCAKTVYVHIISKTEKSQLGLADSITREDVDIAVIENFRLAPNMAKALSFNMLKPVRVIGMLEYVAEINDIDIVFQNPADIANVRTITKPIHNWRSKHEHDAGSHALAYISKRENVPLERLEVVR